MILSSVGKGGEEEEGGEKDERGGGREGRRGGRERREWRERGKERRERGKERREKRRETGRDEMRERRSVLRVLLSICLECWVHVSKVRMLHGRQSSFGETHQSNPTSLSGDTEEKGAGG